MEQQVQIPDENANWYAINATDADVDANNDADANADADVDAMMHARLLCLLSTASKYLNPDLSTHPSHWTPTHQPHAGNWVTVPCIVWQRLHCHMYAHTVQKDSTTTVE